MPYQTWIDRWNLAIRAAVARGATSTRLEIAPPASEGQVVAIESTIGIRLPHEFRATLLNFSRRVSFFWFLRDGDSPPGPLRGIFCGGCNWDIDRIVEDLNRVRWFSVNACTEDIPQHTIWHYKLPFHSIVRGDYIAIDTESADNGRVVYLCHDAMDEPIQWLGSGFEDFMNRWTALGCIDDCIWDRFVGSDRNYVDLSSRNAIDWCDWFGLPNPTEA